MSMRSTILAAAAAAGLGLGLLSGPREAGASVVYSYVAQPQGGPEILPGTSTTLNVYLQEVSTSGSFQAATDGGLYSAHVDVVAKPDTSGVTFVSAAPNTLAAPDGFGGGFAAGAMLSNGRGAWLEGAEVGETAGLAPASTVVSKGTITSLYLLGTVTIALNATPSVDLMIQSAGDTPRGSGDPDAGLDGNTITNNSLFDLDVVNGVPGGDSGGDANPTLLQTEIPVPEPASLGVFAAAGAGLLARRRRADA